MAGPIIAVGLFAHIWFGGCCGNRIRATDAKRLATIFVEEAASIVIAEDPRFPDGNVGDFKVGIATAIGGACADVIPGRDAGVARMECPTGSGGLLNGRKVKLTCLTRQRFRYYNET